MDLPIKNFLSKLRLRKKVVAIILIISIFFLLGTTVLILKQFPKPTSYRPKAEAEPNPQCRLDVEVAATAPTQTPSFGPTSTPTPRPTATSTVRPTSTPTSTPIKPTFTPTPTRVPPPVPPPSCSGLSISREVIVLGETVTLDAKFSNYGIIRYGKCQNLSNCRVIDSTVLGNLADGNQGIITGALFKPTSTGKYVFEINAYESSDCNYLCAAGKIYYENIIQNHLCTRSPDDFRSIGSCTSGCIKWLTVNYE